MQPHFKWDLYYKTCIHILHVTIAMGLKPYFQCHQYNGTCEHISRAASSTGLTLIFQPTVGHYILEVHNTVLGYFPDVQILKHRDISNYMNML